MSQVLGAVKDFFAFLPSGDVYQRKAVPVEKNFLLLWPIMCSNIKFNGRP